VPNTRLIAVFGSGTVLLIGVTLIGVSHFLLPSYELQMTLENASAQAARVEYDGSWAEFGTVPLNAGAVVKVVVWRGEWPSPEAVVRVCVQRDGTSATYAFPVAQVTRPIERSGATFRPHVVVSGDSVVVEYR
jgi:hypothetical protein